MAAAPLLAFYGDDFTGSADALEVLAAAGLKTILFLDVPSPEVLARFGELEAVGIADNTRCLIPDEMEGVVPSALRALVRTGAPILHCKVCSTFWTRPPRRASAFSWTTWHGRHPQPCAPPLRRGGRRHLHHGYAHARR